MPSLNEMVQQLKVELSDDQKEKIENLLNAFQTYDAMFPEKTRNGKAAITPPNRNAYILVNGEPLASILGTKWRENNIKNHQDAPGPNEYDNYLKSEAYRKDTLLYLKDELSKNSRIEAYVPNTEWRIPEEPTLTIGEDYPLTNEQKRNKERILANMERVAFFDRYKCMNPIHLEKLFYGKLLDEKTNEKMDTYFNNLGGLKANYSRTIAISLVLAELVANKNLSLADAFDPTKKTEEKEAAVKTIIEQVKSKNSKELLQTCKNFSETVAKQTKDFFDRIDLNDMSQLFREDSYVYPYAGITVGDLATFCESPEIKKMGSMEEEQFTNIASFIDPVFKKGEQYASFAAGDRGYEGTSEQGDGIEKYAISDALFCQRIKDYSQNKPYTLELAKADLMAAPTQFYGLDILREKNSEYSRFVTDNKDLIVQSMLNGKMNNVINLQVNYVEDAACNISFDPNAQKSKKQLEKIEKQLDAAALLNAHLGREGMDNCGYSQPEDTYSFFNAEGKEIKGLSNMTKEMLNGSLCIYNEKDDTVQKLSFNQEEGTVVEGEKIAYEDMLGEEPPRPNGFQKFCYRWLHLWPSKNKRYQEYERKKELKGKIEAFKEKQTSERRALEEKRQALQANAQNQEISLENQQKLEEIENEVKGNEVNNEVNIEVNNEVNNSVIENQVKDEVNNEHNNLDMEELDLPRPIEQNAMLQSEGQKDAPEEKQEEQKIQKEEPQPEEQKDAPEEKQEEQKTQKEEPQPEESKTALEERKEEKKKEEEKKDLEKDQSKDEMDGKSQKEYTTEEYYAMTQDLEARLAKEKEEKQSFEENLKKAAELKIKNALGDEIKREAKERREAARKVEEANVDMHSRLDLAFRDLFNNYSAQALEDFKGELLDKYDYVFVNGHPLTAKIYEALLKQGSKQSIAQVRDQVEKSRKTEPYQQAAKKILDEAARQGFQIEVYVPYRDKFKLEFRVPSESIVLKKGNPYTSPEQKQSYFSKMSKIARQDGLILQNANTSAYEKSKQDTLDAKELEVRKSKEKAVNKVKNSEIQEDVKKKKIDFYEAEMEKNLNSIALQRKNAEAERSLAVGRINDSIKIRQDERNALFDCHPDVKTLIQKREASATAKKGGIFDIFKKRNDEKGMSK